MLRETRARSGLQCLAVVALLALVVAPLEAQGIRVVRRDILIDPQPDDGSHFVIDIITLVRADGGTPPRSTWSVAVPRDVIGLDVAEGPVAPEAMRHEADRLELGAPPPVGVSRLVLHYVMPAAAKRWSLELDAGVDTLAVMAQRHDVVARGAGFTEQPLGGSVTPARLQIAIGLEPGTVVRFGPARPPSALYQYWWIIVLAAVIALVAGLAQWAWRRRELASGSMRL